MTVEDAIMLAKDQYSNRTEQVLAEEVLRLREELADAIESSRVNYEAFSDQLCRHKGTLKRAEAAEAEVDRLRDDRNLEKQMRKQSDGRAEVAEAERDKYHAALFTIAYTAWDNDGDIYEIFKLAEKALEAKP